jgi:NADH dehydrogenase
MSATGQAQFEENTTMQNGHRVVIVGGGFGGLYTARALRKAPVQLTLVDRRNFHLFQPLLYQVASGALSPGNIAAPLRAVLKKQRNTKVLMSEVVDFDVAHREVILNNGKLPYDTLVIAAGARHHYFGHAEWEMVAPGLKTVEDATRMRAKILTAFEQAERTEDPARRLALMTFVVVGGGPTGVELAGAIAEMAHTTLRGNFRLANPAQARVLLLEGLDRILAAYPPKLSTKAERSLTRIGVTVRTGTVVTEIHPEQVIVSQGNQNEIIPCHTVLWGAGVQGSPLGKAVALAADAELDRAGRVLVGPDCSLPNHPEIFVIGDLANCAHQTGQPLPGVAQVAMQQAKFVANEISRRLRGDKISGRFHYRNLGSMATIGRNAAVADMGWLHLSGYPAWLAWVFIHIFYLIQFDNRILVLTQWCWNYITRNRSARLITGEEGESQSHKQMQNTMKNEK